MNKLVISKEIEESLGRFTTTYGTKENAMTVFTHKDIYADLQQFSPEQFALLLCGWYEVKQPFEVGDWIFFNKYKEELIGKIEGFDAHGCAKTDIYGYADVKQHFYLESLRHATAEEIAQEKKRRFWANLGREKLEFRNGDIIANPSGELGKVGEMYDINIVAVDIENHHEAVVHEYHAHDLTLVCPVEKRVDIDEH